ncbi:MAG: hypothetical protein WCK02_05005 [Bacteroidota bacterium]
MKKQDLIFILVALLLIFPFVPNSFLSGFQTEFLYNKEGNWWWAASFFKFALLATMGESIGLRISAGVYNRKGFGLLPRAIVWGFLGIGIKMAFVVYAAGTPALVEKYFGVKGAIDSMKMKDFMEASANGLGGARLFTAFCISAILNLTFAPVFMTYHKITDTHIIDNGGTLAGFFKWIKLKDIFPRLNWSVQWNFIFKRTIPFFWIPAHTITFLLPGEYQILFAAALGIVLGVIMSISNLKTTK